jgi:hypothetical protein
MKTEAATHRCLEPLLWEPLRGWGFRPQLVVVSGLFSGNPFVDGVLGHNLLLSQAFSVGIPSWIGFLGHNLLLSQAFFHNLVFFHDGILAITKPFHKLFFSRWNSCYHEAFLTNIFFFTMEFWLSRSLSHELFLFHDGILAITKPFSWTFSFSRWNFGYHEAILTNFFFFTMEICRYAVWGKTLFIYITKSIYIGSSLLKTSPLDLEPPLQGKEYGPPYSNATMKVKAILHLARTCFFPEVTYRHVIRIFNFQNVNLRKW